MFIVGPFEAVLDQALNVDGAAFGGHSNPSLKIVVARTKGECKLIHATVTSRTIIKTVNTFGFCFVTQDPP
jgi:hypothetical protein